MGHLFSHLVIPFAGEEVVAVKLTIQFAVEEVQFLGGFETDTFHGSLIGGDKEFRCQKSDVRWLLSDDESAVRRAIGEQ